MEILRRIVYLVFRPSAEWTLIASEETNVDELLRRYILPLSIPAPVATYIGMKFFDREWDLDHGYLVPGDQIFTTAAITFFAIIGSIFMLGGIFCAVAPFYRSKPDYVAGLKVAAYGAMPLLLSGGMLVFPDMVVVSMVALCHTVFLYYVGASTVLGVRAEQEEFICISFVLLSLGSMIVGAAIAVVGII